ncbi:hypothetical protein CAOG_00969 [Capsaspora owczarzaki ATCC 30864]|uniref:Transmembrane protein n=1 Tax=Capsaspora owczarzaki (strain ATCC 30864) TaxID=595528 RepID=A0A0D2WJH2_CAPO3|nr:hypothetical protein CAOG_00969 [Capsaspora owczarzaki ATCC 30864]KJE89513.1 hypothetical protein CAOG_000969 [Capsaspora owczarzaki ATCC 30864]|eukprot:XP_004365840.1 hypothetical protein CAOG_00969 [Capsaspora owczarzaki ATCC 30864]
MTNGTSSSGDFEPTPAELFTNPSDGFIAIVAIDCAAWLFLLGVHIVSLVRHFRTPNCENQRYRSAVRFVNGAPMFMGTVSLACLFFPRAMVYLTMVQSVYEAASLYFFYRSICSLLGEAPHMLKVLSALPAKNYFAVPPFRGCFKGTGEFVIDESHLAKIRRAVLQLCVVRPVMLLVAVLMQASGNYEIGVLKLSNGYFWVTIINTISLMITMWALLVLLFATRSILGEFHFVAKLVCIKLVFLLSVVQNLLLSILHRAGAIEANSIFSNTGMAESWLNWLLVIEMALLAVLFLRAFPTSEYALVPAPGSLTNAGQLELQRLAAGSTSLLANTSAGVRDGRV